MADMDQESKENKEGGNLESYKKFVREKLGGLTPVFARASLGDFSQNLKIPDEKDEFLELYVGVEVMLEVIRAQLADLKELNQSLQQNLTEIEEVRVKDEALLGSIGEGVIAIDKFEKVIYVNEAAEKMFGWMHGEVGGKRYYDFWVAESESGELVPKKEEPVQRVLASSERIESGDFYYARRDKTKFPASSTASPIVLDGNIEGVIIAFRDVTREKEIDRAKDELISLASHQLRTPLSIVKWSAGRLIKRADALAKEEKQSLLDIYATNERMIKLVNALLDVSRLELGTFIVQPEPLILRSISESILSELRPQIELKEIKVKEEYSENLPWMETDPKLVRIVFQNLLSNAVKYTPEKGVIQISLSHERPEEVLLTVADTGYGIPLKDQAKIFTKMFRADNAKEADPDGTGLGLYIVKLVLDEMGGRIWFTSAENQGTTFYVILPVMGKFQKGSKGKNLAEQPIYGKSK